MWDWQACGFWGPPYCPSWKLGQHSQASRQQEPLWVPKITQKSLTESFWWHHLGSWGLSDESYHAPSICRDPAGVADPKNFRVDCELIILTVLVLQLEPPCPLALWFVYYLCDISVFPEAELLQMAAAFWHSLACTQRSAAHTE